MVNSEAAEPSSAKKVGAVEARLNDSQTALKAYWSLVSEGCDGNLIVLLLTEYFVLSKARWRAFRKELFPTSKQLLAISRNLEQVAKSLEDTRWAFHPGIREFSQEAKSTVSEMRSLSGKLNKISNERLLRDINRYFSYRKFGKSFQIGLICHYVKRKTGRPHYRQIADLLSVAHQVILGEETVRRVGTRSGARRLLERFSPDLLDTLIPKRTL